MSATMFYTFANTNTAIYHSYHLERKYSRFQSENVLSDVFKSEGLSIKIRPCMSDLFRYGIYKCVPVSYAFKNKFVIFATRYLLCLKIMCNKYLGLYSLTKVENMIFVRYSLSDIYLFKSCHYSVILNLYA